ncbi:alpha/beta hydrolase [Alkalicoccus chagannorensis]|uniref:alpha/beta hydrolase n=1 Tax=Alkalicoccus chagannorensis TaxID=427072 RepID=UPI000479F397|nr:alpha/beta hydrolase [Alkalicoccus chagannorensis]
MKLILVTAGVFGLLYFGLSALQVFGNQDAALFIGAELSEDRAQELRDRGEVEEWYVDTSDDETLHGWLKLPEETPAPAVIHFGGNAEEASMTMDNSPYPEDWAQLYMNYRGYGWSTGDPSQEALYEDARLLFEQLAEDERITDVIVPAGRSMGSAPAAYTSYREDTAGTILISPYDSRTRVQEHRHPWMPVRTFIDHPFPVSEQAEEIDTPLLGVIGLEDQVIPPEHSRATFDAWQGETAVTEIPNEGHNTLHRSSEYEEAITAFLRELEE